MRLYFDGFNWPERPLTEDPIIWDSQQHPDAPEPQAGRLDDVWIRCPYVLH